MINLREQGVTYQDIADLYNIERHDISSIIKEEANKINSI